ncbi:MAG TPA: exo-alpha-sialidase [Terriglobia bacterium]|nr:exo-alpha-sialidase [Terriglobia bacterium]
MSERFFVATRKGLFTVDRSRSGWSIGRAAFIGDNVTIAMRDPRNGDLFAALNHGHFGVKLHRSRNEGETWSEIPAPQYPPMPEGYTPKMVPFFNKPLEWSLKLIWGMVPGGSDEPGAIWCGTMPGGLFRSEDSGETWELNRPLWDEPLRDAWGPNGAEWPGIHSICVDPTDSRHVTVGVSTGGVWITRDRGKSWKITGSGLRSDYLPPEQAGEPNAQDVHCLVQCATKPAMFWLQHHNGIFKSVDDAASWTEIKDVKPSVFGFAVAVHPKDPSIAWFAPSTKDEKRCPTDGRVVVNRTSDGGKTFQPLTQGLPQIHAYDLVYRHALDVDETGDRLAFGSTTGSLWVSENGGESWQTISSNLPPIYSVRFAK